MKIYMLISLSFFSHPGFIFSETINLCQEECENEKKLILKAEGDQVNFEGDKH